MRAPFFSATPRCAARSGSVAACGVLVMTAGVIACARSELSVRGVPSPEVPKAADAGPRPSAVPSSTASVTMVVMKRRETLAGPPPGWSFAHGLAVWPSRVCSNGVGLVVENFCGCGESLQCSVKVTPGVVELEVHNDGTYGGCDDCYAMTPATCVLPPLPTRSYSVRVHGSLAFKMDVGGDGHVEPGTCWVGPP